MMLSKSLVLDGGDHVVRQGKGKVESDSKRAIGGRRNGVLDLTSQWAI